jgi:hypothetical protein
MPNLYHVDVFMPALPLPNGSFSLDYGRHATQESIRDRYGIINPPKYIDTRNAKVIEVETCGGIIQKILYRMPLDATRDVCIVVIPRTRYVWFVKTLWVNLRSDKHKTLRRERYVGG